MAQNKANGNYGAPSGAAHKVLKPLAQVPLALASLSLASSLAHRLLPCERSQFIPVAAPAPAAAKKKPVNTKPKAWVSLKGGGFSTCASSVVCCVDSIPWCVRVAGGRRKSGGRFEVRREIHFG
jgi:hypothetical protein